VHPARKNRTVKSTALLFAIGLQNELPVRRAPLIASLMQKRSFRDGEAFETQFRVPPLSQRRSLVSDLCAGISQAMGFWGCEARHPRGNQLVAAGFEHLEKDPSLTEGSSRYRRHWNGGTIELHSFCAGWYSPEGEGIVFIRHHQRLFSCSAGEPIEPGRYANRIEGKSNDTLLDLTRPFLSWMIDHEHWILERHGPAYRAACWRHVATLPGFRPWLEPKEAVVWFEKTLADPSTTPRARECKRTKHPLHNVAEKPTRF
jgi:hypothetical protein